MTYNLDVESFILEMKKHPELWSKHSENNKFMHLRQAAWKKVAKSFIPDFEEMTDSEKKDVYKKLQGKWRNLRDSYVRFLRGRTGRNYTYATHLSFLKDRYNIQEFAEVDAETYSDDSRQRAEEIEVWSDEDTSAKRRKKDTVVEYVETNSEPFYTSVATEDEDKSFFDSLLPAVRDFNIDQKLEFRSEVIKLIKDIRQGSNVLAVTKAEPIHIVM